MADEGGRRVVDGAISITVEGGNAHEFAIRLDELVVLEDGVAVIVGKFSCNETSLQLDGDRRAVSRCELHFVAGHGGKRSYFLIGEPVSVVGGEQMCGLSLG